MISLRVRDIYEEVQKRIEQKESKFSEFYKTVVVSDSTLNKLWHFAFSANPGSPNYPLAEKYSEISTIEGTDFEYLFDKKHTDMPNGDFYEFIYLSCIPLYFAVLTSKDFPLIPLADMLEVLCQNILIEHLDGDNVIKSQEISCMFPYFTIVHTSEDKTEELCIELHLDEVGFDDVCRAMDFYGFKLFKKKQKRSDKDLTDILWGEGTKEYFITIMNKSKKNRFPAPILDRLLKLIKKTLRERVSVKDKISDAEFEGKDMLQAMRRRCFEGALKFKGNSFSGRYFKEILSHDDEFEKASTQITVDGKKTRRLKTDHEHRGGTIGSQGELGKEDDDGEDGDGEIIDKIPEQLQQDPRNKLIDIITIQKIYHLLDNPAEKQILSYFLEERGQEEIASMLGVSQSTVSRFYKTLRKRFSFLIPTPK